MRTFYQFLPFIFFILSCQASAQVDTIPVCCNGSCCFDYMTRLNTSPDSVKVIYDHLRALNADKNLRCCRSMLHHARKLLANQLPWLCSEKKLLAILGQPDKINRKLTYLEKTDYGKKIPLQKRWFRKKVYRYDGGIPGRIYLLFIIRGRRVIFWKDYADVC